MRLGTVTLAPSEVTEDALAERSISEEDFKRSFYGEQYEGSLYLPDMEAVGSGAHMLGMQLSFRGIGLSYNYMYRRTHSSLGLSPVFFKFNNPQNFWGESIQQFSLNYKKEFKKFTSTTQLNSLVYDMDNNSSQGLTQSAFTDKAYRYSASSDIEFSQVFSATLFGRVEAVAGFSSAVSGNLPVTNYLYTPFNRSYYTSFSETVDPEFRESIWPVWYKPGIIYK
jgi:hypothetical protein